VSGKDRLFCGTEVLRFCGEVAWWTVVTGKSNVLRILGIDSSISYIELILITKPNKRRVEVLKKARGKFENRRV
jgi:hypothetical protein